MIRFICIYVYVVKFVIPYFLIQMGHSESSMVQESDSSCNCSALNFRRHPSGVVIKDVRGIPNFSCPQGRGKTFFIQCVSLSDLGDLETSSSELKIILLGCCLILTLISISLYYKMRKDKEYYQNKIESLEKNNTGSGSKE